MHIANAVTVIKKHTVRIATPSGSGTGFLFWRHEKNRELHGIATAAHVVAHAHEWEQPIRLTHATNQNSLLLHATDRAIILDQARDTAIVLLSSAHLDMPETPLELAPEGSLLNVGFGVGWLGFPAVAPGQLCYFAGHISAQLWGQKAYLVDGVAINGVSGGPAFFAETTQGSNELPEIIGVVTAYVPNRATGETLPGLSVIQDVSQFHEGVRAFNTLDEAQEQQTPPASVLDDDAPPPPVDRGS